MRRISWDYRLKWMRISLVGIITILVILLLFAAFTIYGNKVGNFVVQVDKDKDIKLSLSIEEDLSQQTERLTFLGVSALSDTTYGLLPTNIIDDGLGETGALQRYAAYSFYLINNSERAVDYTMQLKLIDVVGDPLCILRVMVIEGENDTFSPANHIYAMDESTESARTHLSEALAQYRAYDTEPFLLEDNSLFTIEGKDLAQGEYTRYTIVLWIEGCDIECVDERLGSRVKLEVDITGR